MIRDENKPIVIAIAGASGSGKSHFAKKIQEEIEHSILIEQDSFYKDFSQLSNEELSRLNFDHPNAIDFSEIIQCVRDLKSNQSTKIPTYDFSTHKRTSEQTILFPKPVIIVEGILVLQSNELKEHIDFKVFVDTPIDYCILRRMQRDINERGRTVNSVIEQYLETVRPMFFEYVLPQKKSADIIVSGLNDSLPVIKLLKSKNRGLK